MAQIKPEWELVEEAEQMVARLCDLYPDKLGHISPASIGCAQITNKDQPESQQWKAKLVGVPEPITLYCEKKYIICFFKNRWEGLNKAQQSYCLMRQLLRIPEEVDGKIIAEDLKDVKCLVKKFGVDYDDNPSLPDLTAERIEF